MVSAVFSFHRGLSKENRKPISAWGVFHFFLGYLTHICFICLNQWISKPLKALAPHTVFSDWFWYAFVASLVSNFSVLKQLISTFTNCFVSFPLFFPSFQVFLSITAASCVLFPKLHIQAQNSLEWWGRF